MKWTTWKVVTAVLWSWSLALMVLATVLGSGLLAAWALLVGLMGGTCAGGVLIEVERRRTEHIVDLLLARAKRLAELPHIDR